MKKTARKRAMEIEKEIYDFMYYCEKHWRDEDKTVRGSQSCWEPELRETIFAQQALKEMKEQGGKWAEVYLCREARHAFQDDTYLTLYVSESQCFIESTSGKGYFVYCDEHDSFYWLHSQCDKCEEEIFELSYLTADKILQDFISQNLDKKAEGEVYQNFMFQKGKWREYEQSKNEQIKKLFFDFANKHNKIADVAEKYHIDVAIEEYLHKVAQSSSS